MADFEAFEAECLEVDGLALVEYAMDMQAHGCVLDMDAGRHLRRRMQECATVNAYDNTPGVSGSCAEFVAGEIVRENGEPFLCDPDFIAGGDHAG